jgi:hypothetical protein
LTFGDCCKDCSTYHGVYDLDFVKQVVTYTDAGDGETITALVPTYNTWWRSAPFDICVNDSPATVQSAVIQFRLLEEHNGCTGAMVWEGEFPDYGIGHCLTPYCQFSGHMLNAAWVDDYPPDRYPPGCGSVALPFHVFNASMTPEFCAGELNAVRYFGGLTMCEWVDGIEPEFEMFQCGTLQQVL